MLNLVIHLVLGLGIMTLLAAFVVMASVAMFVLLGLAGWPEGW